MTIRSIRLATAALIAIGAIANARADTLADFLRQGQFNGEFRSYYFMRDYATPNVPNADAYSLSGLFEYQTPAFLDGFSLDASYYAANALGTHSDVPARIDVTLMGAANSIDALGTAFLQYQRHGVWVRLGDQPLATPWANGSDSRALPSTYEAAYGKFTPVTGLTFHVLRILRYRSRTSDGYFRDNNYFATGWNGDANYGGVADLPAGTGGTTGTFALAGEYRRRRLDTALWYYDFTNFARMVYAQGKYGFAASGSLHPYAQAQFVREWIGSNAFEATGTHLFGQPGTATDNFTWGLAAGVKVRAFDLSAAYDRLQTRGSGAFGGGALVSPYTAGYATDPLFTTSMIRGLVELGPGSAWKLTGSVFALDERLQLIASFAEYRSAYNGNDTETYFDAIYQPRSWWKGLSLRNRFEIANGRVNPGHRHFIYDRMQIDYRF